MAQTVGSGQRRPLTGGTCFASMDPRTGEVVDYHQVDDEAAVRAAVARAREAAAWWGGLGFTERRRRLMSWRSALTRQIDDLAGLITAETGKPRDDARLECVLVVAHLDWAARNAERVLRRRRVGSGLLMLQEASTVEYEPYGVVGVIGPWNYPAHTPMGSIGYALAAGNAVVFKPSELTPGVGRALAESLARVVTEHPLLQVVTGFGETGMALCRAGVDKLAFTGSAATAKKVMATCAETLTPVVLECGGKDALLVDPTPTSPQPPTPRSGVRWRMPDRPASGWSGCTSSTTSPKSSPIGSLPRLGVCGPVASPALISVRSPGRTRSR